MSRLACCSLGYVETQFMEPDFDHVSWSKTLQVCHSCLSPLLPSTGCMLSGSQHGTTLQESINATYNASSAEDTYKITDNMLKTLGKPQRCKKCFVFVKHLLHCHCVQITARQQLSVVQTRGAAVHILDQAPAQCCTTSNVFATGIPLLGDQVIMLTVR